MSTYVVRVADLDSIGTRTAYLLWGLRSSVFVVEQECVYQDLDERDLEPGTRHVWVVDTDADPDAPVGCLRVLDDGDQARIGRVAVAVEHRRHGLAGMLMQAALTVVGDRTAVLSAQSHLTGWYERFGFHRAGADFLEDGILHTPMSRG